MLGKTGGRPHSALAAAHNPVTIREMVSATEVCDARALVDRALAQLRAACVRILGERPGCAFPILTGWLVTCAQLVGRDRVVGSRIALAPWHGPARAAGLRRPIGSAALASCGLATAS